MIREIARFIGERTPLERGLFAAGAVLAAAVAVNGKWVVEGVYKYEANDACPTAEGPLGWMEASVQGFAIDAETTLQQDPNFCKQTYFPREYYLGRAAIELPFAETSASRLIDELIVNQAVANAANDRTPVVAP